MNKMCLDAPIHLFLKKTYNQEATLCFGGWLGLSIFLRIYLYLSMHVWLKECWLLRGISCYENFIFFKLKILACYIWCDYFCTRLLGSTQYLFFFHQLLMCCFIFKIFGTFVELCTFKHCGIGWFWARYLWSVYLCHGLCLQLSCKSQLILCTHVLT